jgi:aminopeptidase N
MRTETPTTIYLKDYTAPAWWIDTVDLHIAIFEGYCEVRCTLQCRENAAHAGQALVLDGEELSLRSAGLNGSALAPSRYALTDDTLTVLNTAEHPLPAQFSLETVVRIDPDHNTQLSGLYRSKDGYFTQCEAQGFRRITFYPDRPDVMATFTCTVEADRAQFAQLLSNGNLLERGQSQTRHWARWHDPFPKPAYLFALVAATLDVLEGEHRTPSGRVVKLAVYVEPGKRDEAHHCLAALKTSMRWDETRFGLEMDLDIYMIVAVGDFNMGAMENKGLNIFNSKYVLASPATATDTDYQNIDRIVAHEYFHNWTGNRVTCRDWFQLSLKEGLTVFRDQEFGMDVHARAVTRIQEIRQLRIAQFPEDAGPMAHPIRPASYAEINNFYTATVYEKGAEVIRMIHTLLGEARFRLGMDLYFKRHDGQAVTCEDFVAAMEDASGVDLRQFRRWYNRAGTPRLAATGHYDAAQQRYTLTLRQSLAPTAYELRLQAAGIAIDVGPLHIPVALGLLLPDGSDAFAEGTRLISLTEDEQSFVFEGITDTPVVSLLRFFSAPVLLDFAQSPADLAHLMAHDSDPINRWEAGQRLAHQVLLDGIDAAPFVEAVRRLLNDAALSTLETRPAAAALIAEALVLPAEAELAEALVARGERIDPDRIHTARVGLRQRLAHELRCDFERLYLALKPSAPYAPTSDQTGPRALRNQCLAYLAESAPDYLAHSVVPRLMAHFRTSDNMTDVMSALAALANTAVPERETALAEFYARWQHDTLVVDKWLNVQATSRLPDTPTRVRALLDHPGFDLRVPNKVYALVRAFTGANPRHFHAADGSGYRFAGELIERLHQSNPQVASRIARSFDRWRQFDDTRQAHARATLEGLRALPNLAPDVAEVIARALD